MSSRVKALAIIGSHLQELYLDEARILFPFTDKILVINSRTFFKNIFRNVISLLRHKVPFSRRVIYLGDPFSNLGKILVLSTHHHKVIILQDGGDSINAFHSVSSKLTVSRHSDKRISLLTRAYSRKLARLSEAGRVKWVSCVEFQSPSSQEVTIHSFSELQRRQSRTLKIEGNVVIGSALASEHFICETWYFNWLDEVIEKGSIFLPHRRENPKFKAFAISLGAEIKEEFNSVEVFAAQLKKAPAFCLLPTTPALTIPKIAPPDCKLAITRIPDHAWTTKASATLRQNVAFIESML